MSSPSILRILETVFPIPAEPTFPSVAFACSAVALIAILVFIRELCMTILPTLGSKYCPALFSRWVRRACVCSVLAVGFGLFGFPRVVAYTKAQHTYDVAVDFHDGKLTRASSILAHENWQWETCTIFYDEKKSGIERYFWSGLQRVDDGILLFTPERTGAQSYLGKTSDVKTGGEAVQFFKEDFARIVAALEQSGDQQPMNFIRKQAPTSPQMGRGL